MTPTEKNLLIRVARRLEEQAMGAYLPIGDQKRDAEARRRRDRELGDAKDLRDLAKRQENYACPVEPTAPAPNAP